MHSDLKSTVMNTFQFIPANKGIYFLLLILMLGAGGCSSGGGGVAGPEDPEPPSEPSEVTSSFESSDTEFLPGQVQGIVIGGTTLSLDTYDAELDNGSTVSLHRNREDADDNMLYLFVPVEDTGNYTITFIIDEQEQALDFSIGSYDPVEDPDGYMEAENQEMNEKWEEFKVYLQSLVDNGSADAEMVQQDLATWDQIAQQAQEEWNGMDDSQKIWVSTLIEANSEWLDRLQVIDPDDASAKMLLQGKIQECSDIRKDGLSALAGDETFRAAMLALQYKWCQVDLAEKIFPKEERKKAMILWEATENQFAQITMINLIGRKIDKASRWVDEVGNSSVVADRFVDVRDKGAVITFPNGDNKSIYAQLQFRSVTEADATEGPFTGFALMFSEYISFYDLFIASVDQELIWRPGFRHETETVNFNRYLSIDETSISNDKVILLNTQMTGDEWEVAFATDEGTEQEFTFELVYDDGKVQLSKQVSAKVNVEETTVEEDKQNIQYSLDRTISLLREFGDGDFMSRLEMFVGAQGGHFNDEWADKVVSGLEGIIDVQGTENNSRFDFTAHTGIYSWSSGLQAWGKISSSQDIILQFPSTENGASNDVTLTLSNYADVPVTVDGETFYLPSRVFAEMERNGEVIFSLSLNDIEYWSHNETLLPVVLDMEIFTAPLNHRVLINRSSSNNFQASVDVTRSGEVVAGVSVDLDLVHSDYSALDEEDVDHISTTVKLSGDISIRLDADIGTLMSLSDPTQNQVNSLFSAEVFFKEIKIGELEYSEMDENIRIYYKDGTSETVDRYYEGFLEDLELITYPFTGNWLNSAF